MLVHSMYTIKQAAARSGVAVQLLRAWERRYGVVAPTRTASGYRLYDDEQIARLLAMRRLMGQGWSASNAAERIKAMDGAEIDQLLAETPTGAGATMARPLVADHLPEAFVAYAAELDEPGVESVLDEMFARGSFEQVTGDLLMPALSALGAGWAAGTVDVAGEHAAAGAVQRRLGMAFMAAGAPASEGDLVLVGLPPGARHDLGALAFATAARRSGIAVRYLGADLPLQDWLEAIRRTGARAVVIGAVIEADVDPAERVARALRAANPSTVICFGGRSSELVNANGLEPALKLPADLEASVAALKGALSGAINSA
jgi:DNA-binding transcriptional MerR regulator/methylmalonyl-CoA mutase cobalamin-binding subunit